MRSIKKAAVLGLSLLLIAFSSCTGSLSSSNYWRGVAKEVNWVGRHYKNTTRTLQGSDAGSAAMPIAAFPNERSKSQKFRVGVVISGDYWEFFENLKGLVEGFSDIGWANKVTISSTVSHCDELLSWLNSKKYSNYIEFPQEYFVNVDWGDNMQELQEKYFDRVPDVDVVLAYGGKVSKAFYDLEDYGIPVVSDAVTDCYGAGITASLNDSGKDFFTNKIDPTIYQQQLRLFHDMVGFKKLGIIYGDNEDGIIYGAVNDVEKVSAERGFEIVRNTNVKEEMDDDTPDLYLAALRDIVTKVDAVYIGASTAVTEYDIMGDIVQILTEAKIPSFSLEGTIRVKDGMLFSLSTTKGMRQSGIWQATKISHILAGEKPRSLNQKYESMASVAINLDTAQQIGYKLPLDLLVNTDELYLDWNGTPLQAEESDASALMAQPVYLPKKRSDNKTFRIAVVASGEYWEFTDHLKGIINGLKTSGWIRQTCNVDDCEDIADIYRLLSQEEYSNFISFPREYFINLEWGDRIHRADVLFARQKPDVDLIIGFGGVAGKLFTRFDSFDIPVLLEGITDPVGSGIVYSVSDSGRDFVTCRVDQTQYQRQIQLFHDFVGFKKLGLVYGNDEFGRLYSAVNDVELMSLKLGFDIVRNTNVKEVMSYNTVDLYLAALKDVCAKSDAVYIGASTAVTEYNIMPQIVKILRESGIPSFALEGDIRVKDGVLMGVSSVEAEKIGLYNAGKIAAILYGHVPRLLSQEFTGVPSIVMNLDMATSIGIDVPLSTLATVDQLYGEALR